MELITIGLYSRSDTHCRQEHERSLNCSLLLPLIESGLLSLCLLLKLLALFSISLPRLLRSLITLLIITMLFRMYQVNGTHYVSRYLMLFVQRLLSNHGMRRLSNDLLHSSYLCHRPALHIPQEY